MRLWITHTNYAEQQHFRCSDCGAMTCCDAFSKCTKFQSPFPHNWVPFGKGKPVIRHLDRRGNGSLATN